MKYLLVFTVFLFGFTFNVTAPQENFTITINVSQPDEEPPDEPLPPITGMRKDVLVLWRQGGEEILNRYLEIRNIPIGNTLEITGDISSKTWSKTFNNFGIPVKNKIAELGNINYLVLINFPYNTYFINGGSTTKISFCSLAMVIDSLTEMQEEYTNLSNLFWEQGTRQTFINPQKPFSHRYDKKYYMVGALNPPNALRQLDDMVNAESGGYAIIDTRYRTTIDEEEYKDMSRYPYHLGYSHYDVDRRMIVLPSYYQSVDKPYYLHWNNDVVGARSGRKFYDDAYVDDVIPIPTNLYIGWAGDYVPEAFTPLKGSLYFHFKSSSLATRDAIDNGFTFGIHSTMEPYTTGLPQPAEVVYYWEEGFTLGETVLFSLPFIRAVWVSGCPLSTKEEE